MKNFNEKEVRFFYQLLNHKGITELRFLKRGTFPAFKLVKNEDDFVRECKKWTPTLPPPSQPEYILVGPHGKRNVYAGLRDRRGDLKKCANFGDIVGLQIVTLDIDPIRPAEIPSTNEELKKAMKVAEIIRNWFKENKFSPPIRAMTGNGVCLYFCTPFYKVTDKNRYKITRCLENFEIKMREKFKKELKENNCLIDRMFDLPRIGKVIGTLSVKGENKKERPWRLSYFIDQPKRIEDEKFLKMILKLK
ncbi:MAG: hypothetical protein QME61_03635 [Patescibacteria group bacterium]|nr:hypothetical protein [Patescibacteria group bacterium]